MPSENMKVSLYSTVLNEESSIRQLLDSLLAQSRKPDEIIIVDGGSADDTVKIVNEYIQKGAPIQLIVAKGANIPRGRNIAIKNAKYDIIVSTDAGCRTEKDWLKNLIDKFSDDIDFVVGITLADPRTDFEKCVAEVSCAKIEDYDLKTVIPSGRSSAFRKSLWEKLGGYPEWLDIGEDTYFYLEAKKIGCKFVLAKDAIVYWRMRENYRKLFKQYYLYGKAGREAGLTNIKNMMWHLLFSFGFVFLLGFLGLVYALNFLNPYLLLVWIPFFAWSVKKYVKSGIKCFRAYKTIKFFFIGLMVSYIVEVAWALGLIFAHRKKERT